MNQVGDVRTITNADSPFTVAGVPTDPTAATVTVTKPDGSTTAATWPGTLSRDGAGVFHLDVVLDQPGLYRWRLAGTGTAAASDEGTFYVENPVATVTAYASVDDVKTARRGLPDVLDDLVASLLPRAAAAIDAYAGRQFGRDPSATDRFYLLDPHRATREVLIDDLADTPTEASIVDTAGDTTATLTVATDLVALPRNRRADRPVTALRMRPAAGWGYELRVRGIWGWPAVPEDVREATIATVVDWLKDGQGLTPQTPNLLEPGTPPQRGLPQKARDLVRPHRRLGAA